MGNCVSEVSYSDTLDNGSTDKCRSKTDEIIAILRSLSFKVISSSSNKEALASVSLKKALSDVFNILGTCENVEPEVLLELHSAIKLVKKYGGSSFDANKFLYESVKREIESKLKASKLTDMNIVMYNSDVVDSSGGNRQDSSDNKTATTSDCESNASNYRSSSTSDAKCLGGRDICNESQSKTKITSGVDGNAASSSDHSVYMNSINSYNNRYDNSNDHLVDYRKSGSWSSESTDSDSDTKRNGKCSPPPKYNPNPNPNPNPKYNNSTTIRNSTATAPNSNSDDSNSNAYVSNRSRVCNVIVTSSQKSYVIPADSSPIRFFATQAESSSVDRDDDYGFVDVFQ